MSYNGKQIAFMGTAMDLFTGNGTQQDDDQLEFIPKLTLEDKVVAASDAYKRQWRKGLRTVLPYSGGKDSSVLSSISLQALKEMKEAGEITAGYASDPIVVVVHSNTRVENPVLSNYAYRACDQIRQFARMHDLPVRVDIVKPNLSNNYLVNIIGGRTTATLPGMGSACSDMLKVQPITRHKNRIFKEFGKENVFTSIGTRKDESVERGRNMEERGESAISLAVNKQGDKLLSPIADFTMDDIFFYIGKVRSEQIQTYSDFNELVENYRDMNGGNCMVTVYATGRSGSTGCGARSGCWTCLRVASDTSLQTMTEDERFIPLKPLNKLREYIGNQHWNPSKRSWLSRKVDKDGVVAIAPNAYSPAMTEDLLKFVLTIQENERERAEAAGGPPMFEILGPQEIIAIEMLWARYGQHEPGEALRIYRDVMDGARYPVPDVSEVHPRSEFPGRYAMVQLLDPDDRPMFDGLRDIDAATADQEVTIEKGGVSYSDVPVDDEFNVDLDSAVQFLDFELDYFLDKHKPGQSSPAAVFHAFTRYGLVSLSKGAHSEQDRILRLSNRIYRDGLHKCLDDPQALLERLGPDMSREIRKRDNPDLLVPEEDQIDLFFDESEELSNKEAAEALSEKSSRIIATSSPTSAFRR